MILPLRNRPPRPSLPAILLAVAAVALAGHHAAFGQSPGDEQAGWTFTVGQTSASDRPLSELCGLVPPADWWVGAPFDAGTPNLGLPASFDWRDLGGCTPVRDQGSCGSCWAFGTVGPLECNILIHDGLSVNLSEQWLVSCNREGYGCGGGWWAHEYHEATTDSCGGTGAVLEADFPYVAWDAPCNCPYDHEYTINGWAYIGTSYGVPSTSAIKQAILTYGPVSAAVCVTSAFQGYTGGVFNACSPGTVNHAVVLVGWNDAQGTQGVWILRNSWGTDWGEDGYMYIEYGCSSIGYSACYVDYGGPNGPEIEVTPGSIDFGNVLIGQTVAQTFTVKNVGAAQMTGTVSGAATPFSFDGATAYTLDPAETQVVTVRFSPTLQGSFANTLTFTGGGGTTKHVLGTGVGGGPSDNCADAPAVADGQFTGNNAAAGTDGTATCGGGGTADVWWRYVAPHPGIVVIDTCGSDFDTVLSVLDGCSGDELTCNDDDAGCTPASQVSLGVTTGEELYVRVAGVAGQTGNVTLNIDTTVPPQTISGRVATIDGTGVAGVTITGLTGEPVTDSNGDYTTTVDYGFSGSAVPYKTAYGFSPAYRNYSNVTSDRLNQDYLAVPPTFTISGQVLNQFGDPIRSVTLAGLPGNPVTGSNGTYQAEVTLGFSGTASPTKAGCTFVPVSRSYTNVTANLSGENYAGHEPVGGLRIVLEPEGARDAGVLWRVDSGGWNASGVTLPNVTVGTHAISYATVPNWTAPLTEEITMTAGQTVYLQRTYVQDTHILTVGVEPTTAGTIIASPSPDADGRYVQDTVVELTAVPVDGFRVRNWVGADETPASGSTANTITMTTNQNVIVQFEVMPFHVYQLASRVVGGEGWVGPARGAYRVGEVVTLTATPAEGYDVIAWYGTDDDTSTATTNTVTMDGHKSVAVEFAQWVDCNENGVLDVADIAMGLSADCNRNDVPDECEADTDGDGTIDDCEETDTSVFNTPGPTTAPLSPCGAGMFDALACALLGLFLLRHQYLRTG